MSDVILSPDEAVVSGVVIRGRKKWLNLFGPYRYRLFVYQYGVCLFASSHYYPSPDTARGKSYEIAELIMNGPVWCDWPDENDTP